jgi:hypothetical protein
MVTMSPASAVSVVADEPRMGTGSSPVRSLTAADPEPPLSIADAELAQDRTSSERWNASGAGNKTTFGHMNVDDPSDDRPISPTTLYVDDTETWEEYQGIRVRRAGDDLPLDDADSLTNWGPKGLAHSPTKTQDRANEMNAVECSPADGARDICSLTIPDAKKNFNPYDELSLWVKPSAAVNRGDLKLVLYSESGEIKNGALELPELDGGVWTEAFVRLQGEPEFDRPAPGETGTRKPGPEAVRKIVLRCESNCENISSVSLDDVELVSDLLSTVISIGSSQGDPTFTLRAAAGRSVKGAKVYHDDTVAILKWLQAAERTQSSPTAPYDPACGSRCVYYLTAKGSSGPLPLFNDTDLSCPNGPKQGTIFRNGGGTATGLSVMFQAKSPDPTDISVTGCGFDSNGWNGRDFLTVLNIKPGERQQGEVINHKVSNIQIRDNRFFDSDPPGQADCDLGQDECATLQRQYVVVLGVQNLRVENNRLSHGGRIKAGGHGQGRDMVIRDNRLNFINDNGITIVDRGKGITQDVHIINNEVNNAVGVGIFFGSDGEEFASTDGMALQRIAVRGNTISGAFNTAGIKVHLPPQAKSVLVRSNKIWSSRPRPVETPRRPPSGILVLRHQQLTQPETATGIALKDNQIFIGRNGSYHNGAIRLEGSMYSPVISRNSVGCLDKGCGGIVDSGIWLRRGTIPKPQISFNRISRALEAALRIGWQGEPIDLPEHALIEKNYFSGVPSRQGIGRIWLQAKDKDVRIRATISENRINNTGWGVYCSGPAPNPNNEPPTPPPPPPPPASFALTFFANTYSNPERDVHPHCPPAVSGPVLVER